MMEAIDSLALHADSPAVLLGQSKQLELTTEQRQQLEQIAASAREQARQVLTAAQREQVEETTSGALSPMELMHTQMRGRMAKMREMKMKMQTRTDGKPQMCPMCMQMMEKRMAGDAQTANPQQDEEHEQHHESLERR